jgi:carbamoyl-phosphate synthase large subunit
VLDEFGVEMIGANREAIKVAENRLLFKQAMDEAGLEMPRGGFAKSWDEAKELVAQTGYPRSFVRRSLLAERAVALLITPKSLKRSFAVVWRHLQSTKC